MEKPTLELESVQPNQNSSLLAWKLIAAITVIITVAIIIYFAIQPTCNYTMDQYNQLETGISYEKAQQILDAPGIEQSRVDMFGVNTVCISWKNKNGSNILVTFQNNKLIAKGQAGLK